MKAASDQLLSLTQEESVGANYALGHELLHQLNIRTGG